MTYPYPPPPPPPQRTHTSFSRVLSKAYWTWRRNLALMVPTLLSSSISVLSQSVYIVFGTLLLVQLESGGTLAQINSVLASKNLAGLGPILLAPSVFYMIVEYLGAAFVVSEVVSLLASGFAYSSEYVSYLRALGGAPMGIGAVMSTLKDRWKAMAWTQFLVSFFSYLPLGGFFLLGVWSLFSAGVNLFSLLSFLSLFLVGALFTAIVSFFLMYSLIGVATDKLSGFAALRRSIHTTSGNFGISFVYAIVRVLSYAVISIVASLASRFGVPLTSIASIAVTLLFIPVLHLAKTQVYLEIKGQSDTEFFYGPTSATSDLISGSFVRMILAKLKQGIIELKNFALSVRNLPYHLASALSFVIGISVGAYLATHGLDQAILSLGYAPGNINPTLLGDIPLSAGFDIFLHNWQTSLATALSGMWLVAPSLLALAFNGMILGAVYYLTPNFAMFAAAIFPHGSIEIPSFVLAGSAGIRMGIAFIKSLGKGADSPEQIRFQEVSRQTIYVVIGLAVLFFIAGVIEGNITPVIMRMYGWK